MGSLDKALKLKDSGKHEQAVAALRKLSKGGDEAAGYELAMLLHALGEHSEGDSVAAKLGFRFRLNDTIFAGGVAGKGKQANAVAEPGCALVFDGALSGCVMEGLERVFGPDSDFWSCHGYPTGEFFSYNAPLAPAPAPSSDSPLPSAGTKRKAPSAPSAPSSTTPGGDLMRRLAEELSVLAQPLMQKSGKKQAAAKQSKKGSNKGGGGGVVASFEWWAHSRTGACPGHQLHFDLDEERVRRGEGFPHPLVSCVVFVGEASGGPTLITDLSVDASPGEGGETKGWLCAPKEGRVLVFDGAMMHGVPPALGGGGGGPRTTVMVGLWPQGVAVAEGGGKAVRPNMASVAPKRRGAWVGECGLAGGGAKQGRGGPEKALVEAGRVWTRIGAKGKGGGGGGGDVEDVGRFMIRVRPCDVRELCSGELGAGARMGSEAVTSISLEELMRLRGGA